MKKITYILFIISIVSITACSDFLDPQTDGVLKENQYVGDKGELYSGFMGLAATVQEVADQASFLEGLRGDFLEPTDNANSEMWDVYNYNDLSNNSFVDPKGYYAVIMNANDYLQHLFAYRKENPNAVTNTAYNGMIGGAIRYKVWAYLMLAKIYGEAVYFDDPLNSYVDIKQYPVLQFDEIIEKCRLLIEDGVNGVDGKGFILWSSELFPTQGASPTSLGWDRICPPYEILLAEIYLYQQNYQKTKENCLQLINKGGAEQSYQVNLSDWQGKWKNFGREFVRFEHIAVAYFDFAYHQTNRYIEYYSNNYPNKYMFRPTEVGRERFENQRNAGGVLNDKYRGNGVTYRFVNGDWVVEKFLSGHATSDLIYRNDVLISLYRAGELHLFLIEALIGLGEFEAALGFLNDGIGTYFDVSQGKFDSPFEGYPAYLYETSRTGDRANRGIRGRVDLEKVGTFATANPLSNTAMDTLNFMYKLDSLIVQETCLELSGEAKALYAMNRIGRKWSSLTTNQWATPWIERATNDGENPGVLWDGRARRSWAEIIAAKYKNGKGTEIATELSGNPEAWFIKFDLKNK